MLPSGAPPPGQQGSVEGLKVLGGLGAAEEPVEGRVDERGAKQGPLGTVGLGQEEPFSRGEGRHVELLQGWVCGHQGVLQGPGAEAELLGWPALQHGGPGHSGGAELLQPMNPQGTGTATILSRTFPRAPCR